MSQQLINAYLKELATLRRIGGTTDGVTAAAFKDLLKAWARPLGCTFIPQHALAATAGVSNRVDLSKNDCSIFQAEHRSDEACA
jgi:hypothetical protein